MAWCFDKRVLIGLGLIAVVGFVLAPKVAVASLPLLIGLACPLSMLVMLRGRRGVIGGQDQDENKDENKDGDIDGDRAAELARLRAEVATLRAARPYGSGDRHDVVG